MRPRQNKFNSKRRLKNSGPEELAKLAELANKVSYGGNAEHKRNPGDFNLTPPSAARPGKSLCDVVGIFKREEALEYLREGLKKGWVSDRFEGDWPKNVWSITKDGDPLEAQLENPQLGTYHGYPIPSSDPFRDEILELSKK